MPEEEARKTAENWKTGSSYIELEYIRKTMRKLKDAVHAHYFSFWHTRLLLPKDNQGWELSKTAAEKMVCDPSQIASDKEKAKECIENDDFLWFGALNHQCCALNMRDTTHASMLFGQLNAVEIGLFDDIPE